MSLEKILKATSKYTTINIRPSVFRVSSLPYCGIVDLLDGPADKEEPWDFSAIFYTDIGTVIHTLMQRIMPLIQIKGIRVFGNWRCANKWQHKDDDGNDVITICGQRKNHCFNPGQVKGCDRGDCPRILEYEELELIHRAHGSVLSGHVDMLVEITAKNGRKYYHLLDFKTTGNALFTRPKAYVDRYYPSKKYIVQVETYATLLWLLYKIQISKYSIVYVAREKPLKDNGQPNTKLFTYKFTKEVFNRNKLRLRDAAKSRTAVTNYHAATTSIERSEQLDQIIKLKPCQTDDDYNDYMAAHWYKGTCELYSTDACFKHGLKKHLEQQLKTGTKL